MAGSFRGHRSASVSQRPPLCDPTASIRLRIVCRVRPRDHDGMKSAELAALLPLVLLSACAAGPKPSDADMERSHTLAAVGRLFVRVSYRDNYTVS